MKPLLCSHGFSFVNNRQKLSSIFPSLVFTFLLTITLPLSLPLSTTKSNLIVSTSELYVESRTKCEEISVPMCKGIGYNMTSMPNQFHHEKQDEAGMEAHQFWPLVEIACSDDLRFFLCSMYTPICMEDYPDRLPACRSVCERAQAGCAAIMLKYGFPWPESMDCSNFPPYGTSDQLCMDEKKGLTPGPQSLPSQPTVLLPPPSIPVPTPNFPSTSTSTSQPKSATPGFNSSKIGTIRYPDLNNSQSLNGCNCHCRPPLVTVRETNHGFSRIFTGSVADCAHACHSSPFFTKQEQTKFLLLITITAFTCLICSSLVVCTYLSDRSRYCYPERSIIFLSGCYIMVSLGFIFRYHFGHTAIACEDDRLRYSGQGLQSLNCIINFIFIYFFGMAASLWWVILTLAWFLAASLGWSTEGIESISLHFHIFAWGLPAIQSATALAFWAVDADPLAGICAVGNLNPKNLLYFIIAPLIVYLTVGALLLLSGLFSLMRRCRAIRKHVRQGTDKTGLVKLMIRIIIHSILYMLPTVAVIICNFYLYSNGPAWEVNYNCPCNSNTFLETPYVTIQMFKYVMTLMVGITTCFWILSWKTIHSWWHCTAGRLCCCCSSKSTDPLPRDPLMGSTGGGSSQFIVNSQRSYKQINQVAQSSVSVGQLQQKI